MPQLPYVGRPLKLSLRCPYFLHLQHLKGAAMYYSILSRQYPIFTFLGIIDLSNVMLSVYLYLFSSGLLMVIHNPYFPQAVFISSGVARNNSLVLITPFEAVSLSRR